MKRKKIKSGWLEYFNFSTRERRGAAFLSIILLVQIIILTWLRNHETPLPPLDPQLLRAVIALNAEQKKSLTDTSKINRLSIKQIRFDPNRIDSSIAMAVGISNKQTKVILNYLSKGGVFRTKRDFSKMYCIPESQYKILEPLLLLPDTIIHSEWKKNDRKSTFVDIGKADSVGLMQLRGIGPVFASRIIKYREKLGGFFSKQQLLEVYGIKDSLYKALLPNIVLSDTVPFRFIHLNSDTITVLAAHPYIRWKIAELVISFRRQRPFSSVQDVTAIPLVTEEIFRKLAPYIKPD